MRDMNDMKDAFGKADDGFRSNVYLALAKLEKSEERKHMKRVHLRWIVAAAIAACVLVTGTALAASNVWGIRSFLGRHSVQPEILPDVDKIIQTNPPQEGGQSDTVNFAVREAVYDGQNVYIVVEAKPADANDLLLGPDAFPLNPVTDMGPLFAGKEGTIADYAGQTGKTMLHTWAGLTGTAVVSIDFLLEEDGTLVYMLKGSYTGEDGLELEMACGVMPFVELNGALVRDEQNMQRIPLAVTLANTGTKDSATNTESVEYKDCGVRVDKITLKGSPMATYAEIEFTVIDQGKYAETDGGLWFEFIDENGERLPDGADGGGSIEALDESGTRFIQKISVQASEVLPSEVTLRGYNCWEKNRYETHTFQMK